MLETEKGWRPATARTEETVNNRAAFVSNRSVWNIFTLIQGLQSLGTASVDIETDVDVSRWRMKGERKDAESALAPLQPKMFYVRYSTNKQADIISYKLQKAEYRHVMIEVDLILEYASLFHGDAKESASTGMVKATIDDQPFSSGSTETLVEEFVLQGLLIYPSQPADCLIYN